MRVVSLSNYIFSAIFIIAQQSYAYAYTCTTTNYGNTTTTHCKKDIDDRINEGLDEERKSPIYIPDPYPHVYIVPVPQTQYSSPINNW